MERKLYFGIDYAEGAHPNIINKLVETNLDRTVGYGFDEYTELAKNLIREACGAQDAEVKLLVGGTQTNAVVIHSLLKHYQGVISAETGHINNYEAGAIEFAGNKILTLPGKDGKISANQVQDYLEKFWQTPNYNHMVIPGMVYISQPTEYGTLYSKEELADLKKVCEKYKIPLFADGARLSYALASPENDVNLEDMARYCDVFYIGGTKCGALFGEAVVIPNPNLIPNFFTIIKQHGAVLAKGRMLGIQFSELFKDNLYVEIGKNAILCANKIRHTLQESGYKLYLDTPTNQIFAIVKDDVLARLEERAVVTKWSKYSSDETVIRIVTSWSTTIEETDAFCELISSLAN